jgi:hypothetical protein
MDSLARPGLPSAVIDYLGLAIDDFFSYSSH